MTWILLTLFSLTSYHEVYNYNQQDFKTVREQSIDSAKELNTKGCITDRNYYATENYFFFWMDCKHRLGLKEISIKKIVVVDVKKMSFARHWETNF